MTNPFSGLEGYQSLSLSAVEELIICDVYGDRGYKITVDGNELGYIYYRNGGNDDVIIEFIKNFTGLTSLEWTQNDFRSIDYFGLYGTVNPNLKYLRLEVAELFPFSYCPNVEEIHVSSDAGGVLESLDRHVEKIVVYLENLRSLVICANLFDYTDINTRYHQDFHSEIVYMIDSSLHLKIEDSDAAIATSSLGNIVDKSEMYEWAVETFRNNPNLYLITLSTGRIEFGEIQYLGG